MASLVQELISVLSAEDGIYKELLGITEQKTRVIIDNDLTALQKITDREQETVGRLSSLEHRREEVINNIKEVLAVKDEHFGLKELTAALNKQPEEQKVLAKLHDSLSSTVKKLSTLNSRNKVLIEQSLEMIEFDMNLIRSTRMAPRGNNYTRNASQPDYLGGSYGSFDAKQ